MNSRFAGRLSPEDGRAKPGVTTTGGKDPPPSAPGMRTRRVPLLAFGFAVGLPRFGRRRRRLATLGAFCSMRENAARLAGLILCMARRCAAVNVFLIAFASTRARLRLRRRRPAPVFVPRRMRFVSA
jgi:hypothetical protein